MPTPVSAATDKNKAEHKQMEALTMNDESLAGHVESNINRLFNKFKDKPAIFLSKNDVVCYLYHLLIFDPFLRHDPKINNFTQTIPSSKTFLVHAGLDVVVDGQNRSVALSMGEVKRQTDLSSWDFPIGIEVEHNLEFSAEDWIDVEADIKKLAQYKRGYLLCLNWNNSLRGRNMDIVDSLVKSHANLKFFYVDVCSKPFRSNLVKV